MKKIYYLLLTIAFAISTGLSASADTKSGSLQKLRSSQGKTVIDSRISLESKPVLAGTESRSDKFREARQITRYMPNMPMAKSNYVLPKNRKNTAVSMAPAFVAGETQIYGSLIFDDTFSNDNTPYGIYSLPVSGGATSLVALGPTASYGGVLIDGIYHTIYGFSFFGMEFVFIDSYDATNWGEPIASVNAGTECKATDLCYDATTSTVYGCFIKTSNDGYQFGKIDLATATLTPIADLTVGLNGIIATETGDIYGIGTDGAYYKVDNATGALTTVNATLGVTPKYLSSAAYDTKTKMVYYIECTDNGSVLYKIAATTGEATKVGALDKNPELTGMYIPAPAAEDKAPDAVQDFAANFEKGSLEGNFTFKAPTLTFDGSTLAAEELTYDILANGTSVATGKVMPGAAVTAPVTLTAGGTYKFIATVKNAIGASPKSELSMFIGKDAPDRVKDLVLTTTETPNELQLTWTAPTVGENGGYIDPAQLKYSVIRADGTTAASEITETSFKEVVDGKEMKSYFYSVYAIYEGTESLPVESNRVILGESVALPYSCHFDVEGDLDLFTIIDANNDKKLWYWDATKQAAIVKYNSSLAMDDWLITPPAKMEAGKAYKLSFKAFKTDDNYPEKIEVKMGNAATVEAMTTELFPTFEVELQDDGVVYTTYITPATDDKYYIGFHGVSDADMYRLIVDDIEIGAPMAGTAPEAPTDVKATAAPKGELKATVAFTAPTKAIDGSALTSLTKVEVYVNGTVAATLDNVTPGATQSVEVATAQDNNSIEVLPYSESGAGKSATTSVFTGIDMPGLASNVKAILADNFTSATVTWDAVSEIGANGGYVDPATVVYDIYNAYDTSAPLAEGISGTSFTYSVEDASAQTLVSFLVVSSNEVGTNYNGAVSNTVIYGNPYTVPFNEHFNGGLNSGPWGLDRTSANVTFGLVTDEQTGVASQDGDGYVLAFVPQEKDIVGSLFSSKITVKGVSNPVLRLYYIGVTQTIKVGIMNVAGELTYIKDINLETNPANAWTKLEIPLDAYKNDAYFQLYITGVASTADTDIFLLDNIAVVNNLEYDLAVNSVTLPKSVTAGKSFTATVNISNNGFAAAEGYEVNLFCNDKLVGSKTVNEVLAPEAKTSIDFVVPTDMTMAGTASIYASVVFGKDLDHTNNSTVATGVEVATTSNPTPYALTATVNDDKASATLIWASPEIPESGAETKTDSFEEYDTYAISGVGDWTLYDGDKLPAGGIQNFDFPLMGQLIPFFVMDGSPLTNAEAHTGTKYMCTMYPDVSGGGALDDWMISPVLTGEAQTVSFWAKSYTGNYPETMEILYSTTDTDVANFTSLQKVDAVSSDWTEFTAELPAGAKYFAIRCTSFDAFMLFVDDVTYTSMSTAPTLLGYNVYRNGEKINTELVTPQTFCDKTATENENTYAVTAVYDRGESQFSESASVTLSIGGSDPSGVDGIKASTIVPYGTKGAVVVKDNSKFEVAIATIDGRMVYEGVADYIEMPAGVYFVKVGKAVTKVVVK